MKNPFIKEEIITAFARVIEESVVLDDGDVVDALTKGGFDRDDIIVLYKIHRHAKNTKEILVSQLLADYAYDESVLVYMLGLSNHVSVKDEKCGEELLRLGKFDNIGETPGLGDKSNCVEVKKDDVGSKIQKILNDGLEKEIKQRFFKGIKSQDYVIYLREILIALSDYYKQLCKDLGLGDIGENEAINTLFRNVPDAIIMKNVAVKTPDGKSTMEGFQSSLNGVFKKLRNVMMHNSQKDCNISGDDFIAHSSSINNLLKDSKKYFPLK